MMTTRAQEPGCLAIGDEERSSYLDAALSGQRARALDLAQAALIRGMPLVEVYEQLLVPAQRRVGELWQTSRITVADEHLATAVTQFVIAVLQTYLPAVGSAAERALVLSIDGEQHHLGALMVADALVIDGWDARFLGGSVPVDAVAAMAEREHAALIAVSVTLQRNVAGVGRLVGRIRRDCADLLPFLLIGGAAVANPEAHGEIGADAYGNDLTEAVSMAAGARRGGNAADGSDCGVVAPPVN